ncbi:MAG: hypothetical protein CMP81_16410 [Fulvimarina sp.]|nr:hypothetical protein [Fulvimarina sp.]
MYVAYFDEVKPNEKEMQYRYIVGGIVVAMSNIPKIEAQLTELSQEVFGTSDLTTDTEFHSTFIYSRKGAFKQMEPNQRLYIFERMGRILSDGDAIRKVYACINTDKLFPGTNAAEHAFMHFVERVDKVIGKDGTAILIGDLDDQQAKNMVSEFSRYRTHGTNSKYGKLITRIVDSVHFCRSHHSRMIQLADAYVFSVSNTYTGRTGWFANEYRKAMARADLWPNAYKEWPR